MLAAITGFYATPAAAGSFELLSRTLLQGPARDAAFFENGLITASGGGIAIASPAGNISDPLFVPLDGEPFSIAARGKIAYLAVLRLGLVTVDLSSPSSPQVSVSNRSKRADCLSICGPYLIVSDVEEGLASLDLRDPLKPKMRDRFKPKAVPFLIKSDGDLFAAISTQRVLIFGVSSDGKIDALGEIDPGGVVKSGELHGTILYLILDGGSLALYDLSDPRSPSLLGAISKRGLADISFEADRGLALTLKGDLLPVTAKGGEIKFGAAIEASYPSRDHMPPVKGSILARLKQGSKSTRFAGSAVRLSGDSFVTVGGLTGAWLYRFEGEGACFISSFVSLGFAIDLVARDGYLYLANGRGGARIGKVADNGSVDWISTIRTSVARDVAVSGDILLLADGKEGLKLYDISDPRNPVERGRQSSPFFLSAVVARGKRAYLAGGLGGAEVVDFSDPDKPFLVWREKFSEVRGIDTDERYMYFADGFEGFKIYDIEGEKPVFVSGMRTLGWNCDVFVRGKRLYLAEGGHGFSIADISNPDRPVKLGRVDTGDLAREIHARGNTVFIALQRGGIAAIDVSDPAAPFIAARHPSVDDARGVFADERFVYLASASGGVYIFRYKE